MKKETVDFLNLAEKRRTYYNIGKESTTTDENLQNILGKIIRNTPSAFNSQSTRICLLLPGEHEKLWNIVIEALRKIVPPENFSDSEAKINSFKNGYGTVLFFEDMDVVKSFQEMFPLYSANFPTWSHHTSAMHQFATWTALELEGMGASLQHYNELIEEEVKKNWDFPISWKLIAQMPFGKPTAQPGEKDFQPIETRFFVKK
ncbi:MAG: nitroreductase family protein [Fusobacteriaceae bacterium]